MLVVICSQLTLLKMYKECDYFSKLKQDVNVYTFFSYEDVLIFFTISETIFFFISFTLLSKMMFSLAEICRLYIYLSTSWLSNIRARGQNWLDKDSNPANCVSLDSVDARLLTVCP